MMTPNRHRASSRAHRLTMTALPLSLLLTACAPQPTETVRRAAAPVLPGPVVMLAQVRAAGTSAPDALDVQPLRDPGVADLRTRAQQLETQGNYDGAAQAIAHALAIQPGDPELLQQSAEYALYRHDWDKAAAWARQSFERGPKTGSLCRRNWATLRFVAMAHADVAAMDAASAALIACTIAPPARY